MGHASSAFRVLVCFIFLIFIALKYLHTIVADSLCITSNAKGPILEYAYTLELSECFYE